MATFGGFDFRSLNLGEFVTQRDADFDRHWVANASFDEAGRPGVSLVVGAKGIGKSALSRHLIEKEQTHSTAQVLIDLSHFGYARVADQIRAIADTTRDDAVELLSRYWRRLFLLYCLRESLPHMAAGAARASVTRVLNVHGTGNAERTLQSILGEVISAIDGFFMKRRESAPGAIVIDRLSPAELDELQSGAETATLGNACAHAAGALAEAHRLVSLVVDGIDRIAEGTSPSAFDLVVSAMVHAADEMWMDPMFRDCLRIKVLMPRELFPQLHTRDLDHRLGSQRTLVWQPAELRALVDARVRLAAERAGFAIDGIAQAFHDADGVFLDILRHSMYRPRQLMLLFDEVRRRSPEPRPPPASIATSLQIATAALTEALIHESRLQMPRLEGYIRGLRDLEAVCTLGQLNQALGSALSAEADSQAVRTAIDTLYAAGVVGRLEALIPGESDLSGCTRKKGNRREPIRCEFIFKPWARTFWLRSQPDDAQVVIHPMVWSFAGIRPAARYVVG